MARSGSHQIPAPENAYSNSKITPDVSQVQKWFSEHVELDGKPYFLDLDQARAVTDLHKNTLVTARAGSGKTRVIVAKVIYLVSCLAYRMDEIAIFMFNRTAAAEVNERIAAVKVDGRSILSDQSASPASTSPLHASPSCTPPLHNPSPGASQVNLPKVASTFHKFALDTVKSAGYRPQIITEADQNTLINQLLSEATRERYHFSPREYQELTKLTHNFITRAGQKYPGVAGLKRLASATKVYLAKYQHDPTKQFFLKVHKVAFEVYQAYLQSLKSPLIDFNLLMTHAAELLQKSSSRPSVEQLKYLMVDEYQDFSDLFYNLINAIRLHCPEAKLFAVGDDWQAINRFAGSDVNYFLNFADYFSEDSTNIPLATNYRSCRRIVENANRYMLTNYDSEAIPAIAHNRKLGKIHHRDHQKTKFDFRDSLEDGLGDGLYQKILAEKLQLPDQSKVHLSAAKLLKTLTKICYKHRRETIMILHRHNFTSIHGLTLDILSSALQTSLVRQAIMTQTEFAKQVRFLTMHRSKGLESTVVIILEADAEIIANAHPHATIFELFGDTRTAEIADQERLLYVAMTRAKEQLYILSSDKKPLI